ncbi:MAG: imidazole glycerol phosphate synthase cyclase subunit [Anaerolineaceae bacterium]|jgi:cyclase|nr:imidazole glycerol phosphate synthase cyclase subunit [Anaerolineaceae bacterium]
MNFRIIPKLDIKGPNLVKGIHFEGLRVMGKPEDFARHYYHQGADELIYMDAVASLYGRNSLLDIVERTSREIFIPLCVGGGLRSVEDIRAVLRAGADKVSLNTAAIENPELIRTASRVFGSSTVVVSIEAIKHASGKYEACVEYGRQETGVDAIEWAQRAEALGAGELVVTSINQEGTGEGFDLELTRRIAEAVSIPVIAAGGAGSMEHVVQVLQEGKADAVSIASLLHYNVVRQQQYAEEQFKIEGNVEFLQGRRGGAGFSKIEETTLPELKDYLAQQGIDVRRQIIEEGA